MARSIADIKNQMTDEFISNSDIIEKYGLDTTKTFDEQFSKVSLESILFYIYAFCVWVLESLFDTHKSEVLRIIETMKPHSAAWYVTKAKAFQYGFDLLIDSDKFDNGTHTEDEIEASKIVKYAAVIEQERLLQIKVAKVDGNGNLEELTSDEMNPNNELSAFSAYINRVKDAGIKINVLSLPAENMKLVLDIYYNPLVLNSVGERIDGTELTPVVDVVKNYIANIEFDGTFITASLVDALQKINGVEIPHVVETAYKYGELEFIPFEVLHRPNSGYLKIDDNDLIINYIPR
jgi:hypothetical protein